MGSIIAAAGTAGANTGATDDSTALGWIYQHLVPWMDATYDKQNKQDLFISYLVKRGNAIHRDIAALQTRVHGIPAIGTLGRKTPYG